MNRKFDVLGRLTIPKEMRDKLGFDIPGEEAKIELDGDKIIITNPKQEDKFDNWLTDYILKTESADAELIHKKYKELKK